MLITKTSQYSGKVRSIDVDVTEEQINRYNTGQCTLQDCFPNLSADEREFIKSGITAEEWEALFSN